VITSLRDIAFFGTFLGFALGVPLLAPLILFMEAGLGLIIIAVFIVSLLV
jgi:hypothetical protein